MSDFILKFKRNHWKILSRKMFYKNQSSCSVGKWIKEGKSSEGVSVVVQIRNKPEPNGAEKMKRSSSI